MLNFLKYLFASHQKRGNYWLARDDLAKAEVQYRRALRKKPRQVAAYTALTFVLMQQDKLEEAQVLLAQALALAPFDADANYLQACLFYKQDDIDATLDHLHRSLQENPLNEVAWNFVLSILLHISNHKKIKNMAIGLSHKASQIDSFNRCMAHFYIKEENFIEAFKFFKKISPNYLSSKDCFYFAVCLQFAGKTDEAIKFYKKSIEMDPEWIEPYQNLGVLLDKQCRFDEAVFYKKQSTRLLQDPFENYNRIALSLRMKGDIDGAIEQYRHVAHCAVDFNVRCQAYSNWLLCISTQERVYSEAYQQVIAQYTKLLADHIKTYNSWPNTAMSADKLRIGFLSHDLKDNHPVCFFIKDILRVLDLDQFERIAYTTCQDENLLVEIRQSFDQVHWVDLQDPEQVAHAIREQGIHILVDLSGHSGSSLPVFAYRPAPLQISWAGYWASTGLTQIDYVLMDEFSLPAANQKFFTEKPHYLPATRLCYSASNLIHAPEVSTTPAILKGCITFGSFQRVAKLTDEVLAAWAQILQRIPKAQLRLQARELNSVNTREWMQERLLRVGMDINRVVFAEEGSYPQYLAAYAEVDILLDTFPYPGGTTTCEALIMGVPTLTLQGDTVLARQGAALMSAVGLDDWIANDTAMYIEKAVGLSVDLIKLNALRQELRERALTSALFDAPTFAKHLSRAWLTLWQQYTSQVLNQ